MSAKVQDGHETVKSSGTDSDGRPADSLSASPASAPPVQATLDPAEAGKGPAPPQPDPAASSPGPARMIRLPPPPARPRDAVLALAVLALGMALGLGALVMSGPVVQHLDGPALLDANGRPRVVTALQWDGPDRLSIGTAGSGIVTWNASKGELAPDPVLQRAERTILSLPPLPAGTSFAERPAITLRTSVPPIDQSLGFESGNLGLLQSELNAEARLPVLTFRRGAADQAGEHSVADPIAIGKDVILTRRPDGGPGMQLRFISTSSGQRAEYSETPAPQVTLLQTVPATAVAPVPDGSDAVIGDQNGSVYVTMLDQGTAAVAQPLDMLEFTLSSLDTPDLRSAITARQISAAGHPVTSLAVSADGNHVAAAADDGRIVILRSDEIAPGNSRLSPAREAQEVGLAPPDLWVEPVALPVTAPGAGTYLPLGFSLDGQTITFVSSVDSRLVSLEVGGNRTSAEASIPASRIPANIISQQLQRTAPLISNMWGGAFAGLSPTGTPGDARQGQLPARLLFTTTIWEGSAIDPETGRAVVWRESGEVYIPSPDGEELGSDLGNGQPVADAAFEPLTGALVVLQRDGTAQRLPVDASRPTQLTFAPPQRTDQAPPPDALELSFPSDEMTTLVLWSRTATSPAMLRRYDRATAAPLDAGLELGFDLPVLPDHAALLVSAVNDRELVVRDARSGSTVLQTVFGGGRLILSPTPYGRELGVVIQNGGIWTLRLAPRAGGAPVGSALPLRVTVSNETIAAPVAGGIARDGLSLSANGDTLLVRSRRGQIYAARPARITARANEAPCCIRLRSLMTGTVATRAVLSPDGDTAVVAAADHALWHVHLDTGAAQPLIQMAGPVRALALSPDGTYLAAAADGLAPVVLRLDHAAWISRLPLVGHRPYVVPPVMGPRFLPDAGLPPDVEPDTILLAVLPDTGSATALLGVAQAAGVLARAVTAQNRILVTTPLEGPGLIAARRQLARVRALAPETKGAILHRFELLCPGLPNVYDTAGIQQCGTLGDNGQSKS